jgi:hypothetical protein
MRIEMVLKKLRDNRNCFPVYCRKAINKNKILNMEIKIQMDKGKKMW